MISSPRRRRRLLFVLHLNLSTPSITSAQLMFARRCRSARVERVLDRKMAMCPSVIFEAGKMQERESGAKEDPARNLGSDPLTTHGTTKKSRTPSRTRTLKV